jgi:ATP-dependent helicase/nuclease subunit B
LLFRCSDAELVARAKTLFRDPPPPRGAAAQTVSFRLDPSRVPRSVLTRSLPDKLSPSAVKDYLKCPFRFYLHRVLKTEAVDDRAREPDARGFGTLCHAAVEAMARDDGGIWACGDAERLAAWLAERVEETALALHGTRPWVGVELSAETAKRRLRAFAEQQVAWHADGWEIAECEAGGQALDLDGSTLAGRIDRIDRHRDGRLCVLDYKTTDRSTPPRDAHWDSAVGAASLPEAVIPEALCDGKRPRRWTDLQLPLYREMVRATHGDGVDMGYILLPAALSETGFAVWDGYNDALHAHAMACARAVARSIRAGVFWPPVLPAPRFDDFEELLLGDATKTMVRPTAPWAEGVAGGNPPPEDRP